MSKNLVMRCLGSLILIFTLSSCSTIFLNDSGVASLDALGGPRVLEMQMHLTRGSGSYTMDLVVEVRKQGLTVIGSSFGVRVFTLSYEGDAITEGMGNGLPFYIPNKLIIDDVILAITPRASLEGGLPKNCRLVRDGQTRNIYCNDKLLVSVLYQSAVNKNELVLIERFQPKYKVNFVISEVK